MASPRPAPSGAPPDPPLWRASHFHAPLATSRVDFVRGQVVGAEARALIDLLGHQHFAAERLGQILQAGRDIDRIADHRELRMALVADVARDGHAGVDADPEANGFEQAVGERAVQRLDIGGDRDAGVDRLPAGDFRRLAEAKQRQKSVAQDLVGLAARADDPACSPR